jgi:hypothetical protein
MRCDAIRVEPARLEKTWEFLDEQEEEEGRARDGSDRRVREFE